MPAVVEIENADDADKGILTAYADFIRSQRERKITIREKDGSSSVIPVRFKDDPIVSAGGAELDALTPVTGLRVPQWYGKGKSILLKLCRFYGFDTRPDDARRTLYWLPEREWMHAEHNINVRDVGPGYDFVETALEEVPADEDKYKGYYFIVCEPGQLARFKTMRWYKRTSRVSPPTRTSCYCEGDKDFTVQKIPGEVRAAHGNCFDSPEARAKGQVVVWVTTQEKHNFRPHPDRWAPSSSRSRTDTPKYNTIPLVGDLTISIRNATENIGGVERFPRDSIWQWPIDEGQTAKACMHNTNKVDLNIWIYTIALASSIASGDPGKPPKP